LVSAAQRGKTVTDRTRVMLVCIYYRVAAGDSQRVISGVREFQRTLPAASGAHSAEVLLRCDLPAPASLASPPDVRAPAVPPPAASADPGADATVMETYRLELPAAGAAADDALRAFLARLETASLPHASLLRGARHVELFAPCVL
jgi:hypothetical protein